MLRSEMANNTYISCENVLKDKFPKDLFTRQQRLHGYIGVHLIAFCYACGVLIIVMHAYVKGALIVLLEKSRISRGVAASSIVPAAMSMPAFFVALIGAFITHMEVEGFAVVGCSVFNILFNLACCGIVSVPCLKIHWYSVWRDNVWFAILSVALVWVSADSVIHYTEAALLLASYCVFALILRFNESVERGTRRVVLKYRIGAKNDEWPDEPEKKPILRRASPVKFSVTTIPEEQGDSDVDHCRSDSEVIMTKASFVSAREGYTSDGGGYFSEPNRNRNGYKNPNRSRKSPTIGSSYHSLTKRQGRGSFFFTSNIFEYEEGPKSPFEMPKGAIYRALWIASTPAVCILYISIPDCRQKKWRKWWPLTVVMSFLWISVLAYALVWITFIVADTFLFPTELAALTVLGFAIGLPNLVSSLHYSKEAPGVKNNLPVCNALGSNIFMLSICLGFPWLIKSTVNGLVNIENQGFFYIVLLYFAVFMFPFIPQINRWKIDWVVGVIFLILYILYITFASLIQLNFFGNLVPAYCIR